MCIVPVELEEGVGFKKDRSRGCPTIYYHCLASIKREMFLTDLTTLLPKHPDLSMILQLHFSIEVNFRIFFQMIVFFFLGGGNLLLFSQKSVYNTFPASSYLHTFSYYFRREKDMIKKGIGGGSGVCMKQTTDFDMLRYKV